ncbi:MAG: pilus (MSHA type) biogenesis protein MshL [Pseudomonadota bacterium]|jgi:general secretion pathway protein D
MTFKYTTAAIVTALAVSACTSAPALKPSDAHIRAEEVRAAPAEARIPAPVPQALALPPPKPAPKAETYSVVVNNVPAQELLFALARDARLNVDLHPGISGTVTLNAIDQTLPQLLNRIARQIDMRYELDGPNLAVMPDTPHLRTYKIDYVNMARDVVGSIAINTQIPSGGSTGSGGAAAAAAGAGNVSRTSVENNAKNRFWENLEKNIKDILRETDKILPEGSSETVVEQSGSQSTTGTGVTPQGAGRSRAQQTGIAGSPNPATLENAGTTVVRRTTFREAASVIVNPETGVVFVRATSRQHEKVQEFIDHVMSSARRQVLIEATIVEVSLNDQYQQGIDWQYLRDKGARVAVGQGAATQRINPLTGAFEQINSTLPSGVANTLFTLAFRNGGLTAAIRLLESFGTLKVLSSPKLAVLNNQTALLKVVDNRVFFTVDATQTTVTSGGTVIPSTITAKPNTVSVGLVMTVTPQISEADVVVLNVRPTISRISGFVADPTPALAAAGVSNLVPEIQTREIESLIRVHNGDIAVMGGLMQDGVDYKDDAVPGLSKIPLLGNLFQHRNDINRKTELVIFLRPVVVHDPSISGDFRVFRNQLPGKDFFDNLPGPKQPAIGSGEENR